MAAWSLGFGGVVEAAALRFSDVPSLAPWDVGGCADISSSPSVVVWDGNHEEVVWVHDCGIRECECACARACACAFPKPASIDLQML